MTNLVDAITPGTCIAISRLADEDCYAVVDAASVEILEIPHIAGVPLDESTRKHDVRVRHWPNICGHLERGGDHDIVIWWPSLAQAPHAATVVTAGPAMVQDTVERTAYLMTLIKRLEQHRGVTRVCDPGAARGIVYTPGVESTHLDLIAKAFPGAIHESPQRLSEFPGGLCLSVTPDVWSDPDAFTESVDALIAGTTYDRQETVKGRR